MDTMDKDELSTGKVVWTGVKYFLASVAGICAISGVAAIASGVGAVVGLYLLCVAGAVGGVLAGISVVKLVVVKVLRAARGDITKEGARAFGPGAFRSGVAVAAIAAILCAPLLYDIAQGVIDVLDKGAEKTVTDSVEEFGRYISHYPPANDTAAAANNAVQESPESNERRVDAAFNLPRPDKLAIEHSAMTKMADHMTNRQNVFTNASHGGNALRSEYAGPVIMQSKNYTLQNMGNGAMVFHETKAVGDIPDKNIQNEDVVRIAYEGGRCSVKIDEKREVNAMWWTTGADGLTR